LSENGNELTTDEVSPPISPTPTPPTSTPSSRDDGPYPPAATDRQVLNNSAAKRVIGEWLFPDDQADANEIAARPASRLVNAGASGVRERRIKRNADYEKMKEDAETFEKKGGSFNVDERYMFKLLDALAKVADSVKSDP
jgi:hypothetical protein